jgi:hypothetical protein
MTGNSSSCRLGPVVSAFLVFACVSPFSRAATPGGSGASHAGRPRQEAVGLSGVGTGVDALALRFEPNVGQTDPQVRFLSGSGDGDVFLTPNEIVLSLRRPGPGRGEAGMSTAVRLHILDSNPNPRVVGLDPLPGRTNYFIGNDPTKWRTNVPSFARVKYADVYPGIDLVAYGNAGNLEYDFQVRPGADPGRIAMSVDGADRIALDEGGDLVLGTALGEIRQCAPRISQEDDTGTHAIAGGYAMRGSQTVAFTMAAYDTTKALVIDPQLAFATYFGGTAQTDILAFTIDSAGLRRRRPTAGRPVRATASS